MRVRFIPLLSVVLFLTSFATPARADVIVTPFIGVLFSGALPTQKAAYGASVAAMGKGVIGAELDLSWAPKFVDETALTHSVTEANVTGNLIVGIPIGGTHGASIRPYIVGGVGVIRATAKRSDFAAKLNSRDFAYDLGGGVLGTFNSHFGLRADLRYFRTNSSSNAYRFLRGTGGLTIKF
jgi:opacity protein-like surface antigen